ncbi:hypothetical protein [uncultured Aquimarina sp.]|uniref:hypothetical protein n=1 Tax=uncultured Aquimarina sp. TaxID=575652 RepID=UPI00262B789E|nr:hypothetical protein [uncultured Aquimarina sp.]
MAFGFGQGNSMLKSVESNRKQLKKRNSLKENHDRFKDVLDNDKPIFKKVSEEDLEQFKTKFKEKQKIENRKNLILVFSVFLVVFMIFYLVLFVF